MKTVLVIFVVAFAAVYAANEIAGNDVSEIIQNCLDCICFAASECKRDTCEGNICGPFGISWPYWSDAGRFNQSETGEILDWAACANNQFCARQTTFNYLMKYHQDCNKDGKLTCDDLLLIHYNGGYACSGGLVKEPHLARFNLCRGVLVI